MMIHKFTYYFPDNETTKEVVVEAAPSPILKDIKESYAMGIFNYNTLMLNLERVQGAIIHVFHS
jgi:hypothetical protein